MALNIPYQRPDSKLLEGYDDEVIQKLYAHTLFHGTGRLAKSFEGGDKSKPSGKLVDVLHSVADEGIKPQADHVARLLLSTEKTISLTRQRIYARVYAELFGGDQEGKNDLQYTFGSMEDWKKFYFDETAKGMKSYRNMRYIPVILRNLLLRFDSKERKLMGDFVHHQQRWFVNRAFTQRNHPLIFGVKEDAIQPVQLPYGLGFFEVRSGEIINPDAIRLVEAPLARVNEVREALSKLNLEGIQVIPMEIGEVMSFMSGLEACSKKSA